MKTMNFAAMLLTLFVITGCALPRTSIDYNDMHNKPTGQSKRFIEQDEPTISIKPIPAPTQAAKDDGAKDKALPIVPMTASLPIVAQPAWTLSAGHTIGQDLQAWANKAGWTLVWNLSQDWSVPANSTFNGDFQTAATTVINTLASNGALIRAQFYSGNKTLLVSGPGSISR